MDFICFDPLDDEDEGTELSPTEHLPSRLYMVVITALPPYPCNPWITWEQYWREEVQGQLPAPEFHWPSKRSVYRSRSSATDKLAQFTRWGAEGHVVECTPTWETIPDANARRAFERSWKR